MAMSYDTKPLSTRNCATRLGSLAHRSVALRNARSARLTATGCCLTKSSRLAIKQHVCCDHGLSLAVFTNTCPTFCLRSCDTQGYVAKKASIFPVLNRCRWSEYG